MFQDLLSLKYCLKTNNELNVSYLSQRVVDYLRSEYKMSYTGGEESISMTEDCKQRQETYHLCKLSEAYTLKQSLQAKKEKLAICMFLTCICVSKVQLLYIIISFGAVEEKAGICIRRWSTL